MKRLRVWILLTAFVLFIGILLIPTPDGLTVGGQRTLAIFGLCLVLWISGVLPLAVTSLLAIVLLPLLNVFKSTEAFALFGNSAVFFILGAFILAGALLKTGLSSRLALLFLNQFKQSPKNLLLGILISGGFLSFWMPEHAVAAMMFPVVLEIAKSLGLEPKKTDYGKALFLALAWGTVIGGVATLLGGARNPLAVGLLIERHGIQIGFFEWMVAIVPTVILMWGVAWVVICWFFKFDVEDIQPAVRLLSEKIEQLGPMRRNEKVVAAIMVVTIFCWVFLSEKVGLATIALASSVSLFVLNVVTWKDIEEHVNWGVVLMYGGAIALASAVAKTGAAEWMTLKIFSSFPLAPFLLIVVLTFFVKFLTEAVSNSAVVALLLPVGFSLAITYGIDPVIMVYCIAVPSGLSFCLPMGSPPNAICYASGYYQTRDMIKPGIILNVSSWILFLLMAKFYWPLIGLKF